MLKPLGQDRLEMACQCCFATAVDSRSKWITQLGLVSAAASTDQNIPPLVHMPAPVVSKVLYGGHDFTGMTSARGSQMHYVAMWILQVQ